MAPRKQPCAHCGNCRYLRPRGLCHRCYWNDAIRARYQARRNQHGGVCGGEDFNGGYQVADRPTDALPGSAAKSLELQRRVAMRLALHHPRDARPTLE